MAAVSAEACLAEARSKAEVLSRKVEGVQQRLDASEGLERDLKRLGRETEEMHQKAGHMLQEKQVQYSAVKYSRRIHTSPDGSLLA